MRLKLADEHKIDSTAFPPYPQASSGNSWVEEAAKVALKTIKEVIPTLKHVQNSVQLFTATEISKFTRRFSKAYKF